MAAIALVLILGALLFMAFARSEQRHQAQMAMKSWGLAFRMYSMESSDGCLPPRAMIQDVWAPDLAKMSTVIGQPTWPDFSPSAHSYAPAWSSITKALSPKAVEAGYWAALEKALGEEYIYVGHALGVVDYMVRGRIILPEPGEDAKRGTYFVGGLRLPLIARTNPAAESPIPLLIENTFRGGSDAGPKGANVLFLDGRVDFVPFHDFPELESFLRDLARLRPS